ncbi:MAG: sialate O-acetylesterase [Verrucomicrobiia bacterium]
MSWFLKTSVVLGMLCWVATGVGRAVEFHPLFSDGAVLQQEREVPVWGKARPGDQVKVTLGKVSAEAQADADGKWMVHLPKMPVGGPFELVAEAAGQRAVSQDVYVGEVWLVSGQSNVGLRLKDATGGARAIEESEDPLLRVFEVPAGSSDEPVELEGGSWVPSSPGRSGSFSAVAYFFAQGLRAELKVPVGVIVSEVGGSQIESWTSRRKTEERFPWTLRSWESTRQSLARQFPDQEEPPSVQRGSIRWGKGTERAFRYFRGPTRIFNAMIYPLFPVSVRAVVWYQGESNQGQAHQYRSRLPAMIEDWREHWGQEEMPFLIVMLPGYGRPDQGFTYELRDAQFETFRKVPHTALAIGVDLGDEREVHPPNKRPLGERLTRLALATQYGKPITPTGPLYREAEFRSGEVVIHFDYAEAGLEVRGEELSGFLIAGDDEKFVPAQARIVGQTVVVSSPDVPNPVAVRYAWTNTPTLTLWSTEGLPAAPFRTDDFTLKTNWDARRR